MKLFTNGVIHTMNKAQPTAEAVLVDDAGRIAGVGSFQEIADTAAERIDLQGRTLIPGFNDAHIHVSWLGELLTRMVDARISVSPDIPAIVAGFQQRVETSPAGTWLQGMGYNEALLPEGRHVNRDDLDAAGDTHPILLIRSCGHVAAANSLALQIAGIDANTPDPPGGVIVRDDAGLPTGVLQETAINLVLQHIPDTTPGERIEAVEAAQQLLLAYGVTSATDPDVTAGYLETYHQMEADNALIVRLNLLVGRRYGDRIEPLPEKYVSDTLRCDSVKFFADGGMTSATAAISIPYRETGTKGVLIYETEDMAELMWEAHSNGYRIATHGNGDVALEQVLGVYEAVNERDPRPDLRHRIEHLALPTDDHLRRCAKLGVMVATQTVFLSAMGAAFRRYMPELFYDRAYGVRMMQDAGITVALSTDGPVVPDVNPLLGLKAAIDRHDHAGNVLGEEQGISPAAALEAYTLTGAVLSGDEANFGSIEVGKWADLAVLSGDPVTTPAAEMLSLQVEQTYVAGEQVFARTDEGGQL